MNTCHFASVLFIMPLSGKAKCSDGSGPSLHSGKEMKKKRENAWKEGRTVPLPPWKGRGERTAGGTSGQAPALVKFISYCGGVCQRQIVKILALIFCRLVQDAANPKNGRKIGIFLEKSPYPGENRRSASCPSAKKMVGWWHHENDFFSGGPPYGPHPAL